MAISLRDNIYAEREADRLMTLLQSRSHGDKRTFEKGLANTVQRLIQRGTDHDITKAIHLLSKGGFRLDIDQGGRYVGKRIQPAGVEEGRFSSRRTETGSRGILQKEKAEEQELILTPQSSNVYSFTYHREPGQKTGTLYVTYKASAINPHSVTKGSNKSGWDDLRGKAGKTVGKKTNEAGATYAYFGVQPAVYTEMKAAGSKGGFVWDRLRVRGSMHGHKYRYSLVQAQMAKTSAGHFMPYIPRKATSTGFKSRALADINKASGRRGYSTSTLPEGSFSSRHRR